MEIAVSNRLPGDGYGLFSNPLLAERLLDRDCQGCCANSHVVISGRGSAGPQNR